MKTLKVGLFLFTLYLSSFLNFLLAQDISGNLEGRITDSTGTALTGVNISLQSDNLQGLRGTTTDDEGRFRIFSLPIGSYKIRFSFVGYRETIFENVQINLGKTTNLGQIQLEKQTYNLSEVIVSGEKFIIDPTSTTYGGNLNSKDFEKLPIDRNYQNMVSLLPQANSSYYGDGINIGGATGFENKYFVDGVEVTDLLYGKTGTSLPYNFVKEVEVKTGGYESEFRSALGGLINVVTYSGTNEFHGSVFGFYTNNQFTSTPLIGLRDPNQGNFSDYDVGFSIGGPIIQDKLWFYTAYNPTFTNRDVYVPSFGNSTDRTWKHSFAAKLNWRTSQQLNLALTVTGDPTERKSVGYNVPVYVAALLNPDPYFQDLKSGGVNVSLSGTYSLGQNILLRGSISRIMKYNSGKPSTERGNEILFWDYPIQTFSGGTWGKWDTYTHSNIGKLDGTISFSKQILNVGIEYKAEGADNQERNDFICKFDSTMYVERIGVSGNVYQRCPSVFLQDTWQILQSLSVHCGIRWDGLFIIGSNGENRQRITVPIQPRVGFTFLPDENGSQKIFGSYGSYTQELSLLTPIWWYSEPGSYNVIYYDHDPRISRENGVIQESTVHSNNQEVSGLVDQFYDDYSLGYERTIGENFLISIQGVYRTLREAISSMSNPGKGTVAEWPRPKRNYTALILTIERKGDEHFNFLASYVLSRDYGNYGGLFDAFYHSNEPNTYWYNGSFEDAWQKETGLLPNDRTHVFKFSGSYNFSFGFSLGISFLAQSGTPLCEYANG
jgi:hypothetical protein